jgi:hypothetical protein
MVSRSPRQDRQVEDFTGIQLDDPVRFVIGDVRQ